MTATLGGVTIEWDTVKDAKNLERHGMSLRVAAIVMASGTMRAFTLVHDSEVRTIGIGRDDTGRILTVVYTMRETTPRIISVRPSKKKERNRYGA